MKKVVTILISVCLLLTAIQLKAQVKIGDNPTTINAGSVLEMESTDKGVLFPRVNLTDLTQWQPLAGTAIAGMTVYNTNTTTGVGFYYWDGAKWVKKANTNEIEWVYNPSSAKIELKRSGTAPFNNRVFYKPNGGRISTDFSNVDNHAYNYTLKNASSFNEPIDSRKILNRIGLNIDIYDETKQNYMADVASIILPRTLIGDYNLILEGDNNIIARTNIIEKQNPGKNQYLISNDSFIDIQNGSIDGYATSVSGGILAKTNGYLRNITGFGAQVTVTQLQTGTVDNMIGFGAQMGFVNTTTTTVNKSIAFYGDQFVRDAASKPNIGTAAGFWYDGFALGATNIPGSCQNHYGIYLENINRAVNNYAIYTNSGRVSLGDVLVLRSPGAAPANSADPSGENGEIRYDNSYIYIKAGGSWKRAALSGF